MDRPTAPAVSLPSERGLSGPAVISETVVGLLRQSTGRGPNKASTVIASDLAVVTLLGGLTRAEKTLAEQGRAAITSRVRAAIFQEIRPDAVTTVEAVTGKAVVAYLAAQEYDPDVAIIAFYFAPHDVTGNGARCEP